MTLDQTAWPTRTLAEFTGQQLKEFLQKNKNRAGNVQVVTCQTKTKDNFQLLTD